MGADPKAGIGDTPEVGTIGRLLANFARRADELSVIEKINRILGLRFIVALFLVIMSLQSVRLQIAYRDQLETSSAAAINIERVNGLIYAIVMESRGIFMAPDRAKLKQFSDGLLKHNRELAEVVARWGSVVRFEDAGPFSAFKQRITQFIDFRAELVRRGLQISTAAAREWGVSDANLALRSQLNTDLETLATIEGERSRQVAARGDTARYASWYLFALTLVSLLLMVFTVLIIRRDFVGRLAEIIEANDQIAHGNVRVEIPFIDRKDQIGDLARAVRNFQQSARHNIELEQLKIETATQHDKAIDDRDRLNDKNIDTQRRLNAALDRMTQGVVMVDANAKVVANRPFKLMYQLPPEIFGPDTTFRDILTYRAENGLFLGDVDEFMTAILARVKNGRPSVLEHSLPDGRVIRVSEQPMAGGGWVATHEDLTEQLRAARILERTERFLATVVENVTQAITAKDSRDLRYIFINNAAEKLFGLPRAKIIGKSARELFPTETADLIEQRDRQLLAGGQDLDAAFVTINTPNNGQRIVTARRFRISGESAASHVLLSLIDDRTGQVDAADAAA